MPVNSSPTLFKKSFTADDRPRVTERSPGSPFEFETKPAPGDSGGSPFEFEAAQAERRRHATTGSADLASLYDDDFPFAFETVSTGPGQQQAQPPVTPTIPAAPVAVSGAQPPVPAQGGGAAPCLSRSHPESFCRRSTRASRKPPSTIAA